jgi:hypothetical protein
MKGILWEREGMFMNIIGSIFIDFFIGGIAQNLIHVVGFKINFIGN